MMSEEGWIMHGMEAIERIIKHEIIYKQDIAILTWWATSGPMSV